MKTIVWDIDDVLNDLMRTWFERWWRPSHPNCSIVYNQLSENPPHELLGVNKSEYLASLDEFRLSQIAREMTPASEVLTWFREYGDCFRHIALTSTALNTAPNSAAWLMRHFGRWIRSFNVIPSPRQGESIPLYDQSKESYLSWWGKGDIFIEDNPLNAKSAQNLEIQTILIQRPWNQSQLTMAEALGMLTNLIE